MAHSEAELAQGPRAGTDARYSRRVLGIQTPVSVTLAEKKIAVSELIGLVPGSMLNFDVHCDEPLVLRAAGTPVAIGETIKIGDKFGLRVREVTNSRSDQD